MSLPDQLAAYADCLDLYERALGDEVGARAKLPTVNEATMFRMRMHQARSLERAESRRMYDKTDIRYNKSEFDVLKVTVREDTEGGWWVYVTRHGQEIETVETLS